MMAGIYLHIPFCHSKCAYCDFYSMGTRKNVDISALKERLTLAIDREFQLRFCELGNSPIETVYIGGGTPSILSAEQLRTMVGSLPRTALAEFTIEANPEDISIHALQDWKELGINRISMGMQSLCDDELQRIGRRHTAAQALEAMAMMRQAGFDNYSVDLIYGLPGQSLDSWERSLRGILAFRPPHLSAYLLSYEHGTRLTHLLENDKISATDDDTVVAMYDMLTRMIREAGYEHYEISNFAMPGHRALHNSNYWKSLPYLGLGPAAHSYDGAVRRVNPPNILQYLRRIESGNLACQIEEENENNLANDAIMVALRTADGLDLSSLLSERRTAVMKEAQPWIDSGKLTIDAGRFKIPEREWLMSDAIISSLMFVD